MLLLFVIIGWIAVSIPIALVVGLTIRRGQRPIRAQIVELSTDESARMPVPSRM